MQRNVNPSVVSGTAPAGDHVLVLDHGYTRDALVSAGRDVEAQVLSRAVRWHSQSRVLLNGSRTVVFR